MAKLEELESIKNQVKALRLHEKLRKQNFHGNMKKAFEPITDTIKNASKKLTKTKTETS